MNIKNILNKLSQPFTNIEYYKSAIDKPFWNTFSILALVLLISSFVSAGFFVKTHLPTMINSFTSIANEASENYPEDLVIDWDGTNLHTNRDNFEVYWPSMIDSDIPGFPSKILFFENSDKSPQDLNISTNDYISFINTNNIYHINDETKEWTAQSLGDFAQSSLPLSIDKKFVVDTNKNILIYLENNKDTITLITIIIHIILFTSSKVWFLAIETILVILLFRLYSMKLTTNQVIKLSMNIMIPTVVLSTIAELLYSDINFPLQTITFWILLIFISLQFKKTVKVIKKL